jgi:hypothetical protein
MKDFEWIRFWQRYSQRREWLKKSLEKLKAEVSVERKADAVTSVVIHQAVGMGTKKTSGHIARHLFRNPPDDLDGDGGSGASSPPLQPVPWPRSDLSPDPKGTWDAVKPNEDTDDE